MDEPTDPKPETPDHSAEVAALKAEIAEIRTKGSSREEELQQRLDMLTGQLQVLGAAATDVLSPKTGTLEEPPDILQDPDKALDYHFRKRTAPLLAEQARREAARERQMVEVKRSDDWKKWGKEVEQIISQNRIPPETLSTPGTYEQLIDMVKARHISDIVKEQVAAEVAAFQSNQAKGATSGPSIPGGRPDETPKTDAEQLSPEQLAVAQKLKIDPKRYAEESAKTSFDGVRLRGEVIH